MRIVLDMRFLRSTCWTDLLEVAFLHHTMISLPYNYDKCNNYFWQNAHLTCFDCLIFARFIKYVIPSFNVYHEHLFQCVVNDAQ